VQSVGGGGGDDDDKKDDNCLAQVSTGLFFQYMQSSVLYSNYNGE